MRRLRGRIIYLALALNVSLIAVYVWTATETTTVDVAVRGSSLTAAVNGYRVAVEDDAPAGGLIGLYMADARQGRTYDEAGPPPDSALAWLGIAAARLREEPTGAAWGRVTVYGADGRIVRDESPPSQALWEDLGSWRAVLVGDPVPGKLPAERAGGQPAYTARFALARGVAPAGVLVNARDAGNGLLLLVRPEYRDVTWWRLRDGQWEGPLEAGVWSKTGISLLQDDLRLLLVTQQVALAMLLAIAALGWIAGRFSRAPSRRRVAVALAVKAGERQGQDYCSERLADGMDQPAVGATDGTLPGLASESSRRIGHLLGPPALVALLALVATGVAAYVAVVLLEAMPHVQDAVTYLFQAKVLAMGRLSVPASPVPKAFEQEFIVNYAGRAFGKYPPGYSLMLVPGVLAGVPWLINPLQAGLTTIVTYLIGREAYGKGSGLLAALLVVTSPFFIFMSGSFMAHPTGLLFISLFVLLFIKCSKAAGASTESLEPPGGGRAGTDVPAAMLMRNPAALGFLAGLALGLAFLTRPWTAVCIAAPFGLYAGYRVVRSRGGELRRYGPILAGLAPLVLALLAYNYALTGTLFKSPMELWWPFDKLGFGPGIGISGRHTIQDGLWNTYRNLTELMKHLYGWPAYATLALALVPFLTLRAGRWDWLFLGGWLALVVGHVAWWAEGVMYGPRYYYESLGLLALLTARGVAVLAQVALAASSRGGGAAGTPRRRVAGEAAAKGSAFLPYLFALALIGYNVVYYLPPQWSLHRGYNYVNGDKLRAVQAQGIHNAVVFVDLGKWYEWWNYGSVFPANAPTLDGDVVFARDEGPALVERVIDLYPGRRYYRLSGTEIEELKP